MNPFDIGETFINIVRSELLFEQYIMALNQDKYDIEVRNYDSKQRNRMFFDFMKLTFNRIDELYLHE